MRLRVTSDSQGPAGESTPLGDCPICGSARTEVYQVLGGVRILECEGCGSRFVHPVPAESELRERYQSEHAAGKWEARFSETSPRTEMVRRARLVTTLSKRRGRILDVGCGDGRFLDAIQEEGWRPVGTEIAASAGRLASPRHSVLVGDISALRSTALFDAITFWDVLEHLANPRAVLFEARQRLRVGGILVISMPNLAGTASLAMRRRWHYYDLESYGHLHHLTPRHLRMLLRGAGLRPIYSETRGSVDLRDLPRLHLSVQPPEILCRVLDKLSGVLARVAEPLGYGNTQIVAGVLDGESADGRAIPA